MIYNVISLATTLFGCVASATPSEAIGDQRSTCGGNCHAVAGAGAISSAEGSCVLLDASAEPGLCRWPGNLGEIQRRYRSALSFCWIRFWDENSDSSIPDLLVNGYATYKWGIKALTTEWNPPRSSKYGMTLAKKTKVPWFPWNAGETDGPNVAS